MIEITQKLGVKLVLIGILPVDEALTSPYKEQKYYQREKHRQYNQIIENTANRFTVKFVDMYDEWERRDDFPTLFADGLHPNTKGHKMIFERVVTELFGEKL